MSSIPKVRFSGFVKEWELCRLGDVGEFKSNGVDKKIHSAETPVNLLNYMDVYKRRIVTSQNCGDLMQVTAKTTQIKENNIEANDVFFTPTSETAEDIGHVMVIEETLENTVYSYHLMRYRPNKNAFYSTFPNYGFATDFVRKQMSIAAQGVQRFVINKEGFESLKVPCPTYEEQKRISEMLGKLDKLISLYQCKLEKLKQLKQSMLHNMFV